MDCWNIFSGQRASANCPKCRGSNCCADGCIPVRGTRTYQYDCGLVMVVSGCNKTYSFNFAEAQAACWRCLQRRFVVGERGKVCDERIIAKIPRV